MRKNCLSCLALLVLVIGLLCSLSGCNMTPTITEAKAASDVANEIPQYCAIEINDVSMHWDEQGAVAHGTKYTKYAAYYGTVDLTAMYSISQGSNGWKYDGFYVDDDSRTGVVGVDLSGSYNSFENVVFELEATSDPNVYTMYINIWDDDVSHVEKCDLTFKRRDYNNDWFWVWNTDCNNFTMEASYSGFAFALQDDKFLLTQPYNDVLASGLECSLPVSWSDPNVCAGRQTTE